MVQGKDSTCFRLGMVSLISNDKRTAFCQYNIKFCLIEFFSRFISLFDKTNLYGSFAAVLFLFDVKINKIQIENEQKTTEQQY